MQTEKVHPVANLKENPEAATLPFWEMNLNPITMQPPVWWYPRQDTPIRHELESQLNNIFSRSE